MKKLLIILMSLFISFNAYGAVISLSTLSEDASINDLNRNFSTIEDEINGSLSSANILDDTLLEADFADEINPRVRYSEIFNDLTDSGHLPATSASTLTSDISAGTSYVEGYRVVTSATSKTYTASRDTWVYIDINSNFQYEAVANDAAQPAEPSNSLLLAKVVTDADNITSVIDHRTTSLSVSSPENFDIKGYYVLSSDTQAVSIDPGVVYVGSTRIVKTSITALRTVTAADWHDGVKDTDVNAWWYIGMKSTGDIKWLGATPPNIHDTAENTDGTLYYYDDGTNHWRVIGVVRMTSGGWIDHMIQAGDTYFHGKPVNLTTTVSAGVWKGLTCDAGIPPIANMGIFGLQADHDNAECGVWIRPFGTLWTIDQSGGIFHRSSTASDPIGGQRMCLTRTSSDTEQIIEYRNDSGDEATRIDAEGFVVNLRD